MNGRIPPPGTNHLQQRPPIPSNMSHNPQGPMPHMFGNFNPQGMQNSYPQINAPPIHMQQPSGPPGNPNINVMQPPYPAQPYNNTPAGAGAGPTGGGGPSNAPGPTPSFPATRPREWETSPQGNIHERDSKRMRPYPPNPNGAAYPSSHQPYNRAPPNQMPPRNPNLAPSAAYPQIPQQHPGMLLNNPPIHPPNQQALAYQQRPAPYPQQPAIPPAHRAVAMPQPQQPRDSFQFQPKHNEFPDQPGQMPGSQGLYSGLPPPPRKGIPGPPLASTANPGVPMPLNAAGTKEDGEQPMSFKDFLLKQPDSISSQAANAAYEQYLQQYTTEKPNTFFDQHKDEEWFRERYDPEYVSKRVVRIREEVLARAEDFRILWDIGGRDICAPELTPDAGKNPRKPQSAIKNVQSETTQDIGKDEGIAADKKETEMTDSKPKDEEEMIKTEDANAIDKEASDEGKEPSDNGEVLTDADGQQNKKEDKQEPMTENGDQKDPETGNPEKDKQESEVQLQVNNAKPNVEEKSTSTATFPNLQLPLRREHQKDTIFMRGIPLNLNREDLTAVLKHGADGSQKLNLRRLKLGDINPNRSLERFGWAVYDTEETAARALDIVRGARVVSKKTEKSAKDRSEEGGPSDDGKEDSINCTYDIDCMLNLERRKKFSQGRILPSVFTSSERLAHDVRQSATMMRQLDSDRHLDPNLNPLSDEYLSSLKDDGDRLDHVVTYLREVHYFCYFSGNEFLEDPTSMPPQELRPTRDRGRPMSETDNRLVRRIDERAKWVLERDYDRPRSNSENGEAAKEEAVRIWLESNTKHEDKNRYRCGLPPHKLFKGPEFVHKHLRSKHADKMHTIMEKAMLETYRANFENDPSKDEVISIFDEGMAMLQQRLKGRSGNESGRNQGYGGSGNDYGRPETSMPLPMYNTAMNPLMMQPFPMMMMGTGFTPGYAGAQGYANTMAFPGRGMNAGGVAGPGMMQGSMVPQGMKGGDMNGSGPPRRPPPRHYGSGHRDFREDSHRGRRGGHPRRGGGDRHRGGHEGRPVDPRARGGSRRGYNDLDAPGNGPSFDLVRYDDV